MDDSETTHAILREIREQLRTNQADTNERFEQLGTKIDQTNRRLDTTNRHLLNTEARLVTEISALRAVLTEAEPEGPDFRERLEQVERELAELRQRG
jgi:hypothetical protein